MQKNKTRDVIKAMKRMAREEYGSCPTRVRENKKKYRRNRQYDNYGEDC